MNYSADQLIGPVRLRFIALTLGMACLTVFLPLPMGWFGYLPDLASITFLYWVVHQSQKVGFGVALIFGFCCDVLTHSFFGLHAFIYVTMVYQVFLLRPAYIAMHGFAFQSLIVCALLLFKVLVTGAAGFLVDGIFILSVADFCSLSLSALLWPLLNKMILTACNRYYS